MNRQDERSYAAATLNDDCLHSSAHESRPKSIALLEPLLDKQARVSMMLCFGAHDTKHNPKRHRQRLPASTCKADQ